MGASPVILVWFALIALALAGVAVSILALKRGVGRRIAYISIALKAAVLVAIAGYFIALRAGVFTGWQDLTTFASILVLTLGALGVALVLDIVGLVMLARHRAGG